MRHLEYTVISYYVYTPQISSFDELVGFLQIPLPKINSNHAAQAKRFSYKQATSLVDRMM